MGEESKSKSKIKPMGGPFTGGYQPVLDGNQEKKGYQPVVNQSGQNQTPKPPQQISTVPPKKSSK